MYLVFYIPVDLCRGRRTILTNDQLLIRRSLLIQKVVITKKILNTILCMNQENALNTFFYFIFLTVQ